MNGTKDFVFFRVIIVEEDVLTQLARQFLFNLKCAPGIFNFLSKIKVALESGLQIVTDLS